MLPRGRTTRIVVAASAALLVAYAIVWTQLSPFDIGRSDFTAFYVGGTLLREGHGPSLYDESLQAPLHAQLIAPDREGNLPFVDPPVAAALVLPVTVLGLDTAYRVWAMLELAVLAAAVTIAVRAGRPPTEPAGGWSWAAGAAAMAGLGTLFAVSQAQWTPLVALGLAVAYAGFRRAAAPSGDWRERSSRTAAVSAAAFVACAFVGKPQLALGLVAFMAGWRRRDVLLGAAAGFAAFAAASFVLVGPAGIAGLARIVTGSTTRWDTHLMLGVSGVAGALAGSGATAVGIGSALMAAACAAAYLLGHRVRQDPQRLSVALAGAAALSLLAAPHAYLDDLAMLAPVAAWSLARAGRRTAPAAGARRRTPLTAVLALWVTANAAALVDLAAQGRLPAGPLSAYVLAGIGAVAIVATRGPAAGPLRYRAGGEAALGSVAHGLRRG